MKLTKKLTRDQFLEFVKDFKNTYTMPGLYAVGQPFMEDEKLIAIRWQTINIDKETGIAKNLGFYSALVDYYNRESQIENNEIFNLIIRHESANKMLETYFSDFVSEPGHLNLEILQGAFAREDDVFVLFYPTQDFLKNEKPVDWIDASCRLAMISHLAFKPNEINLDGVFGLLPILCYMSDGGVMTPEKWQKKLLSGDINSYPVTTDKFPPMWWGAPIPAGVRIADTSRVRLGAYLSPGTTVMHEGFVNFNAGTLGSSMVEGRISAGVIVDNDSDVGGGASIMGTLSGGGKEKIIIGKNCLLGANSGTGISLGDRCTIEAGLYITPGMIIKIEDSRFFDSGFAPGLESKAIELSGKSDMLFIRDSVTGTIIVRWNKKPNKLNLELHS